EQGPGQVKVRLACCQVLTKIRHWELAAAEHAAVVRLAPKDANLVTMYFTLLTNEQRWDLADVQADRLAQQYAKNAEVLRACATTYQEAARWDRAITFYSALLALQPGDPRHWVGRGSCLAEKENYSAAEADFGRVVAQGGNDPEAWFHYAL